MMAIDLHNSELMIPSHDLFDTLSLQNNNKDHLSFGSSESGSELSSPIGSYQQSSSFTESSEEEEEDCFIGELTRQMVQYMLQDEDKHEKSSPVVSEFENMKINEETARNNHGVELKQALIDDKIRAIQFFKLKQQQAMKQMEQKARVKHYQSKVSVFGGFTLNSNTPWYTLQQQQQSTPCYTLQQQQQSTPWYTLQQQQQSTPWYTLQQQQQSTPCYTLQQQQQSNQQTGSDRRAVFLKGSGSRTGSCGTGVFLPRGAGTPCNSRKKQGCATVLIPARVVQALKLHFEKTGVPSRFNTSESGRHSTNSPQKGRSGAAELATNHHEDLSLPQEWTY